MILVGNQRGGSRDLARHLLKQENERVEVHEIRGFASNTLMGAFQESYAISWGTQCKQHLYSLSLSPPKDAVVSDLEFEVAIDRAEQQLGLSGQPRAIVFHEKYGDDGELRRHAHAVWCRIDTQEMKAVHLSFTHNKLQTLARELFIENEWQMPRGLLKKGYCDPRNFTLAEWQQAKRRGDNPRLLKALFQDAWAISDSRSALQSALLERGFILARGDRRGFVAVDHTGEVYSLSRWTGIKAKELRARIGDEDDLSSVDAAHRHAAMLAANRLEALRQIELEAAQEVKQATQEERERIHLFRDASLEKLGTRQLGHRRNLEEAHQRRYRTGLLGLLDCLTGQRKRVAEESRLERERLTSAQKAQRRRLIVFFASKVEIAASASESHDAAVQVIDKDIEELCRAFGKNHLAASQVCPRRRRRRQDGPSR